MLEFHNHGNIHIRSLKFVKPLNFIESPSKADQSILASTCIWADTHIPSAQTRVERITTYWRSMHSSLSDSYLSPIQGIEYIGFDFGTL
jgi:hypothetical protein